MLAVNILGRFLANKDNNVRYVALNTLLRLWRWTLRRCSDADRPSWSASRIATSPFAAALQLVYSLVNENNIETLAEELLEYLSVAAGVPSGPLQAHRRAGGEVRP